MYDLMFNSDAAIQEQTLYLLRNFLYEHADAIWSTEAQLNELVLNLFIAFTNSLRYGY